MRRLAERGPATETFFESLYRINGGDETGKLDKPASSPVGRAEARVIAILIVLTFIWTVTPTPGEINQTARTTAIGSFGQSVRVNDNTAGEQMAPVIVSIPGHGVFVAWQDSQTFNSVYSSRSVDNGTTFTRNVRVDDPIFNTSTPRSISIATSMNGTVVLTWDDNRRNTFDYDIFLAKSYDYGAKFARNVKVDDSNYTIPSWQEHSSAAFTLGGTLYVAWTDSRTGHPRAMGAYSTDMGKTFSASKAIVGTGSSFQNQIDLAANGNRIFAAYIDNVSGVNHPYICYSTNGGKTFTNPTRLDNTGNPGSPQTGISISPMPNGGVVASWSDTRNGDSDIYVVLVSADGNAISPNIRVSDDTGVVYAWQSGAHVTADQLGNVYATWMDERITGTPEIRFAYMMAGKSQFNASLVVSPPGTTGGIPDVQMFPSIAADEPGRVFIAWQEDRGGTSDIYVAHGVFPNMYNLALLKGWNFVSMFLDGKTFKASTLGLMRGDVVAEWNSSKGRYDRQYIVGVSPPASDFVIGASKGYWVYSLAAETLTLNGTRPTSIHSSKVVVPSGGLWVAIGFESLNSTRKASDIPAMFSVPRSITSVVAFNPTTGKYSTFLAGVPSTDFRIVPGQGYWAWCLTNGTLTYSS